MAYMENGFHPNNSVIKRLWLKYKFEVQTVVHFNFLNMLKQNACQTYNVVKKADLFIKVKGV